jgi:ABC-type arginine/histidine transport system permease subunit
MSAPDVSHVVCACLYIPSILSTPILVNLYRIYFNPYRIFQISRIGPCFWGKTHNECNLSFDSISQ